MPGIKNPQVTTLPSVATEISALRHSGYDLNMLKYPQEVGGPDVPSYITFNIYVPTSSTYEANNAQSLASVMSQSQINSDWEHYTAGNPQKAAGHGSVANAGMIGTVVGAKEFMDNPGVVGTVDGLAKGAGAAAIAGVFSKVANKYVTLRPAIRRIAQSVSIYMPDTVNMQMQQNWNQIDVTKAMGALGQASSYGAQISNAFHGLQSMQSVNSWGAVGHNIAVPFENAMPIIRQLSSAIPKLASSPGGMELLGKIGKGAGLVGEDWGALALRSAGVAVNPQVELLYQGTSLRTYDFIFRFQPRSQKESQVIASIIQVFKYFSSPAIQAHTYGRYVIIPGEFDITFKFGQAINPFISKISTCALLGLTTNYNPSDHWATMVDGAPPEIELQLRFMETDMIYQNIMATPDGSTQNQGF